MEISRFHLFTGSRTRERQQLWCQDGSRYPYCRPEVADLPAHVAYVPMVFGEDSLDEKLVEAG
jgi:hypothetical protein